ncbi:hypothetical protein ACVWZK_003083 [Bradyrhizobium sp. GM0.4]
MSMIDIQIARTRPHRDMVPWTDDDADLLVALVLTEPRPPVEVVAAKPAAASAPCRRSSASARSSRHPAASSVAA